MLSGGIMPGPFNSLSNFHQATVVRVLDDLSFLPSRLICPSPTGAELPRANVTFFTPFVAVTSNDGSWKSHKSSDRCARQLVSAAAVPLHSSCRLVAARRHPQKRSCAILIVTHGKHGQTLTKLDTLWKVPGGFMRSFRQRLTNTKELHRASLYTHAYSAAALQ